MFGEKLKSQQLKLKLKLYVEAKRSLRTHVREKSEDLPSILLTLILAP